MLTFFFAVEEQRDDEETPEEEEVEEVREVKFPKVNKSMTSFSRQQVQALRMLLNMPPDDREAALNMFLAPQSPMRQSPMTPQSARIRRHDSHGSASSHDKESVGSASSRSPRDNGSVCSASSHSSRVHHPKDNIKTLASFLVKQYLSSKKIWDHLYNSDNRSY